MEISVLMTVRLRFHPSIKVVQFVQHDVNRPYVFLSDQLHNQISAKFFLKLLSKFHVIRPNRFRVIIKSLKLGIRLRLFENGLVKTKKHATNF